MKHLKRTIYSTVVISSLVTIAIFITNCKKADKNMPKQVNASIESNTLKQKNEKPKNFLVFNNVDDFDQQLEALLSMSHDKLEAWETQQNFRSMRSAFDAIVQGEELLSARLDALQPDSIDFYRNLPTMHCKEARDYQQTYIIAKEDDGSFFEPNINNYNYAYITNTYGIVKIGKKIYQFTKEFIKTIDDGDKKKIDLLIISTESNANKNITVTRVSSGYVGYGKISSTSTFVKSAVANNGRNRTIVYQNWDQIVSSSQPNKRVTTYKVRVRSLVRRLRGAWYDNRSRILSLSGNTNGNITPGQLANNNFVRINWSFGISNSTASSQHTWDYFLPNKDAMNQSLNSLITDGFHPQLFSSSITGNASGGASATTTYP